MTTLYIVNCSKKLTSCYNKGFIIKLKDLFHRFRIDLKEVHRIIRDHISYEKLSTDALIQRQIQMGHDKVQLNVTILELRNISKIYGYPFFKDIVLHVVLLQILWTELDLQKEKKICKNGNIRPLYFTLKK